jgi:hypothetical protein
MSEVSALVRSKLTPRGLEYHEKVQDLIWLEDVPKGWDVPPKSPSQEKDGNHIDGRNHGKRNTSRDEDRYEEELTSGDSFHQSYLDSISNDDGEVGVVCTVGGNYVLSSTEDEESVDNVDDFDGNGSVGNMKRAKFERPDEIGSVGNIERAKFERHDYKLKGGAGNDSMMDVVTADTGGMFDESTKTGHQIYTREREDDLIIDMPTEKKVEVAMKYLLDAWEHHKVKSGECQAHINTLVELREMHDTRLRAIRQKIDKLLYYDKHN